MPQGTIITFYSYKGGVGRSFALANVAVLLARWKYKVLCIDWDIEAPGLSYYFSRLLPADGPRPGLVNLLTGFPERDLKWRAHVTPLMTSGIEALDLIAAGQQDDKYTASVQSLNWAGMYEDGLGVALEQMCVELRKAYDFILIDGRTGVTDFGGIITAQLPDILAVLFTANEQSLEGAAGVAERAIRLRNELPFDRPRLLVLPIAARFEANVEYETAQHWKNKYEKRLADFYGPWAVKDTPPRVLIEQTTIPYVAYWSFGERLSALEELISSPTSINHSLETIAALLAQRLDSTDLLAENRDAYVDGARRLGARSSQGVSAVFISYSAEDRHVANQLRNALLSREITTVDDRNVVSGDSNTDILDETINRAQHMVVLVGPRTASSKFAELAIRRFQRQSSTEESRVRLLLPVLLHGASASDLPRSLLNFQTLSLDAWTVEQIADRVAELVAAEPPRP